MEIKKSIKPVNYEKAVRFLEKRIKDLNNKESDELLWILEHGEVYTAGTSSKQSEILNKSIKVKTTNRGGKITYHGPGQLVCYFVIDLKRRKKDLRWLLKRLESVIIKTLFEYNIKSFSDRKNIGIWVKQNNKNKKVAAIGLKVKKWVIYHGFSININNNLDMYKNIVPCGIKNMEVTNLKSYKNISYKNIDKKIIKNFTRLFKI